MITKATGYSGFDPLNVTGYSNLKPGQAALERDYYKDATRTKPDGKTYLSTYSRFGSNHQQTVDAAVKPSDYKRVSRGDKINLQYDLRHNPELFRYTKQGKAQMQGLHNMTDRKPVSELRRVASTNIAGKGPAPQKGDSNVHNDTLYKTTKHWVTNYQGENNKTIARPASQAQRPIWSYPKREHAARRTFFKTEYENTLGTYGHNPRNMLNQESTSLKNDVNDLTMGTTKVTRHVPGYGGFLVKTDLNPKAIHQSKSEFGRDIMRNKLNLNENFNVKVPGYSGHKPMSCMNDRGSVRPQLFSTHGETFY